MRFRAFLSYSHADAAWAGWLLRRLETYRVPSRLVGTQGDHGLIERRLGKVFRDRDELPSAGDLGVTIREALSDSAALVVICSPTAAQSRWVNAEVEAFQASGRADRVFCFVVGGVPGSVDPAQACFPPALVRPDANGDPHEPLAADARAEGDGRERAFLKLVAGLLGVGYDALAQREAQRRTRKFAIVAAASFVGMTIALGLAATAYVARNDAQRRQAQAEDILGFMLGDLREKLTTVGRLDLMRSVDDKATGYFATLDPRDMTDRALEEQTRSLTRIGEVRLGEGNHDAAMSAFREAHARSTALYQRAPDNGQRLFDLAQAEYWIGFVALEQGRYEDVEIWFSKYRDSAIKLAAMDRGNFEWQQEVLYGYHNLAALDESRGRYVEAEKGMRQVLRMLSEWSATRPADTAMRSELAETMSWLGQVSAKQGKLKEAEAYFLQEVEAFRRNATDDPRNSEWKQQLNEALLILAKAQWQLGRRGEALAVVDDAVRRSEELADSDPDNSDWQIARGVARWWQANVATGEQEGLALRWASEAVSVFEGALLREPKNGRVRNWLVRAHQAHARLELVEGKFSGARVSLAKSADLIETGWTADPDEQLRLLRAENLLLTGELNLAAGSPERAKAAWEQIEPLLLAERGTQTPFERLDPLVRGLHRLGRMDAAVSHKQRLADAGYVPDRPWPTPAYTARTEVAAR